MVLTTKSSTAPGRPSGPTRRFFYVARAFSTIHNWLSQSFTKYRVNLFPRRQTRDDASNSIIAAAPVSLCCPENLCDRLVSALAPRYVGETQQYQDTKHVTKGVIRKADGVGNNGVALAAAGAFHFMPSASA